MKPRSPGVYAIPALRGVSAVLLALLVAAVLDAQPRAAVAAAPPGAVRPTPNYPPGPQLVAVQPAKKEPDKKESDKKDPDKKEPTKPPEIKWPTEINGKDIKAVMKDMEDLDPTIREFAARTIPLFGPPAQKGDVSKLLIKRMHVEDDPGVRISVFTAVGQLQFEHEADNKEALRILINTVDTGARGGLARLHAIQTITLFGAKGEGAITSLTGVALSDPAYETRRTIASALGRVGFSETTGPNMKALTALADKLANDKSAAVRMEALQSLLLLGPPWAEVRKADDKTTPLKIKAKDAETIINYMRVRVGDPKTKTLGKEKDKQVEIWARLVLMRFDPKEVNDDNLDALARYLTGAELGAKIQALQALTIVGEGASRKLTDVIRVLEEKDAPFGLTVASIQVLMAMGAGAKPAIPNLQKMLDEKKKELGAKKIELAKKKDDLQLISDAVALDELVKLLEVAIKHINEAKPVSPAVSTPSDKKP
jgi:hypothetical protein